MHVSRVKYFVVHCSDSPNGSSHDIRDIDAWHKERGFKRSAKHPDGWRHVGYHWVLPINGDIQLGRDIDEVGAHCRDGGLNSRSWGVCLIGRDQFTRAQWHALRLLVEIARLRVPDIKIVGHCEYNKNKTCPGFNVQDWLAGGMSPLDGHVLGLSNA